MLIAFQKTCRFCQKQYRSKPSAQSSYCSKICLAEDFKVRLKGSNNPNFKSAGHRICVKCNKQYFHYDTKRKYCSFRCYRPAKPIGIRLPKKLNKKFKYHRCVNCDKKYDKPSPAQTCSRECFRANHSKILTKQKIPKTCIFCNSEYFSSNKNRQYCSYPCFVKSGGAIRAGQAAIRAKMKYGNKKDANHKEIVQLLRALGAFVKDLSDAGNGVPDLIVWHLNAWRLVEIKNTQTSYGKKGLNKVQRKWADDWRGGTVYIIKTDEDVKNFMAGKFDKVEKFPPEKESI